MATVQVLGQKQTVNYETGEIVTHGTLQHYDKPYLIVRNGKAVFVDGMLAKYTMLSTATKRCKELNA